jgi:hypothetical protein
MKTRVYPAGTPLPTTALAARDPWIETIAHLMDGAIPIGRWSIGLDALLGLVPGFGDMLGAMISMLIVVRAAQAGVPRSAVARMFANVALDTLVGAIPLAGDVFDFVYKSNIRNLRIYEESLYSPDHSNARHWLFFAGLALAAAALIAVPIVIIIGLARIF